MAVYLEILKTKEDMNHAEYDFVSSDGRRGLLRIEKVSGEITLCSAMPDDKDGGLYARAKRKVSIAWKAGGDLPDKLIWAS